MRMSAGAEAVCLVRRRRRIVIVIGGVGAIMALRVVGSGGLVFGDLHSE